MFVFGEWSGCYLIRKPVDFRLIWNIEDCISISVWIVHGPQRMIWVLSTHFSVIGRKVKWILLRRISYVQVQVTVEFSHAQVQVLAEFSGVWWIVVGKEKSGVWWIAIGKEKWRLNLEFRAWRNSLESEVCGETAWSPRCVDMLFCVCVQGLYLKGNVWNQNNIRMV